MQHRRSYEISIFVIGCILINCIGKWMAETLQLPLWMDSFGTVLAAYVLGPICGAFIGAAVNIIYGFHSSLSIVYALTNVALGVLVGICAKKGFFENLFKTLSLSFLVTMISVMVSVPLNYFFSNGMTGNVWGDGVIDFLGLMGIQKVIRCVIGEFYVDFLDKVVTLLLFFSVLKVKTLRKKYGKLSHVWKKTWLGLLFFLLFAPAVLDGTSAQAKQQTTQVKHKTRQTKQQADHNADSQFNTYVRTIYNGENGLPGGAANDIAQTKDGVLWIGTYGGLYRYTGSRFRWVNEFETVKNVNCLYTDEAGRLWIGTNDSGVSICINGEISNVLDATEKLPADSVRCITENTDGNFYVGTTDALAIVSLSGGLSVTETISEIKYAKSLSTDAVGTVAAVTDEGCLYLLNGSKIVTKKEKSISGTAYTCCTFDDAGKLYLGTQENTIEVYRFENETLKKEKVISCRDMINIKSLQQSEDGYWFVCADNGTGYIDKEGIYHTINTNQFNSSIDHMLIDYQGNLWFTSSRLGLLRMCKSVFTEIYDEVGLPGDVVNSVTKWNGQFYFGTDNGLHIVDQKLTKKVDNSLTKKLEGVRIRCLKEDSRHHLWICTGGEGVWEIAGDRIYTYKEKDGMTGDKFRSIIELADGTMAAAGDFGISYIKNRKICATIKEKDGLTNPKVLCMLQKEDGTLLAGTDGNGIAVIQDTNVVGSIKKSDGLGSNVIMRIVKDSDNEGYFVITSNSICYITKAGKIRILKNFPYYNNFDLVEGNNGEVFVLSAAGIYVVDKKKLLHDKDTEYDLLDSTKGLRESLTPNAWNYVDDKDNLYLSGGSGVVYMNINAYSTTKSSYRMLLKSIKLDGETGQVERGEVFHIPRGVSRVEIIPEVINYSTNDPYVRVWLEGFDKKATIVQQSDLKNIVYTNLPTGNYTFHMAVYDNKKSKVIEESTYQIVKDKEIYDHWWFYLYFGIVFTSAIAYLTWLVVRTQIQKTLNIQKKELELTKRQIEMGNETILTIAKTVDAKDVNTSQHSFRVSEYASMIAQRLGYSDQAIEDLKKSALLHDIGKIAIPDRILNKDNKLTDEEYAVMKSHVVRGGEILKNFTLVDHVYEGALYHHERYDGKGYVQGLKGEKIPLNARIIGIADAFDAMTANRVYRKKLDMEFVLNEIKKGRGTQFDPMLVDIMLDLIEDGTIDVQKIYAP